MARRPSIVRSEWLWSAVRPAESAPRFLVPFAFAFLSFQLLLFEIVVSANIPSNAEALLRKAYVLLKMSWPIIGTVKVSLENHHQRHQISCSQMRVLAFTITWAQCVGIGYFTRLIKLKGRMCWYCLKDTFTILTHLYFYFTFFLPFLRLTGRDP